MWRNSIFCLPGGFLTPLLHPFPAAVRLTVVECFEAVNDHALLTTSQCVGETKTNAYDLINTLVAKKNKSKVKRYMQLRGTAIKNTVATLMSLAA